MENAENVRSINGFRKFASLGKRASWAMVLMMERCRI